MGLPLEMMTSLTLNGVTTARASEVWLEAPLPYLSRSIMCGV
jgi:hypothetical protein